MIAGALKLVKKREKRGLEHIVLREKIRPRPVGENDHRLAGRRREKKGEDVTRPESSQRNPQGPILKPSLTLSQEERCQDSDHHGPCWEKKRVPQRGFSWATERSYPSVVGPN